MEDENESVRGRLNTHANELLYFKKKAGLATFMPQEWSPGLLAHELMSFPVCHCCPPFVKVLMDEMSQCTTFEIG